MSDISSIKSSEILLSIRHPSTDAELGITVQLMSIQDPRLKQAKRQIQDRRSALEQRGKFMKAEEIEENANNLSFAAMTGWHWEQEDTTEQVVEGYETDKKTGEQKAIYKTVVVRTAPRFHGVVPEFNKATVLQVFAELPWLREQIDAKVGETKDFFGS